MCYLQKYTLLEHHVAKMSVCFWYCNFRSHVYITYRGDDREQTVSPAETWQWNRCTSSVIVEKTGLELCGELSLPKQDVSLVPRGAAVARVYLNKRDTYTGVHFDASYIQSEVSAVIHTTCTL